MVSGTEIMLSQDAKKSQGSYSVIGDVAAGNATGHTVFFCDLKGQRSHLLVSQPGVGRWDISILRRNV